MIWNPYSGSLWYGYKRLRDFERSRYSRVEARWPSGIDQPVDPWVLHRLRLENDFPKSTGYSYRTLASESHVDDWIQYGLEQQLYNHDWLDHLDQVLLYSRTEANAAILDKW